MSARAANTALARSPEQPGPGYAKLTRPRVHEAIARPRLFALLDGLRARHQVLWIASPPGAGKTTLASTYLTHCGAPFLWCQLDQADADPATLCFFLAEARRAMSSAVAWEPPRPGSDALGVTRLFFRHLYAQLPPGAVLVFDDVHAYDWENAGALLECAFAEVPEEITVLALGREAPPPRLARMELDGRVKVLGYRALRFTLDEACALAGIEGEPGPVQRDWLALVDGWAAGVIMLRSLGETGSGGSGAAALPPMHKQREAVFRYFAGEILQRLAPAQQEMLLILSFLPELCAADAVALTGQPHAAQLLDTLYRQRLFVERSGTQEISFRFQALFSQFLQSQALLRLTPEQCKGAAARAAAIVEARGRLDDAARLFQQAGEQAALGDLLLRHARAMIAGGRGEAWRLWMSWLGPAEVEARPWLWYWHGMSLLALRPWHARSILARAQQAFQAGADITARLLCIAGIIDSYDREWSDLAALPHWTQELAHGLARIGPEQLDSGDDLRLHARLTGALLAQAPDSPFLPRAAERALHLMPVVDDLATRLAAAPHLLHYCQWRGHLTQANALVTSLARVLDEAAVAPASLVRWYGEVARWYSRNGEHGQARQTAGVARRIVMQSGLDALQVQTLEIEHLLGTGELAAARAQIDAMRAALPEDATRALTDCSALDAHWHALAGDADSAVRAAQSTLRLAAAGVMPVTERARHEAFLGACLAWRGEVDAALACYQRAAVAVQGLHQLLLREELQFVEAHGAALERDGARAASLLRTAMRNHRQREAAVLFPMVPALAARIAALALDYAIEAAHVRALITRQGLAAPRRTLPGWPWPAAVRMLGPFSLSLRGDVVAPSGKSQQRPLALLKILVAAGSGGRSQQALLSQLWGQADVVKSALSVTVHRLRKLLGNDALVIVAGGRLRCCPERVWSDVAALAELCEEIAALPGTAPALEAGRLAEALLDLYRGPFCEGSDEAWILPERDRHRKLFLDAVAQLGRRLEDNRQWSAARDLYQRALDAEPLSEASYRGAMRCAHALEGPAAAFAIYRRCRDTLSILLGIAPAAETDKLAVTLGLK